MLKGIDVSEHQGIINWDKVKQHIDYAILRIGYGDNIYTQDDKYFKRNADECTRLNIPFGVYIYSYAQSTQQALSEAQHVLRLIKDYKLSYPVYYDLEDVSQANLFTDVIASYAKTFCNEIEKNGYYVGVYANTSWWNFKLINPIFDNYTKWVAQYAPSCTYSKPHDMWQYASDEKIEGINGNVDVNYSYKDFPLIINKQEVRKPMVKGVVIYKNDTEYPYAIQMARKLGYVVAWSGTSLDYSVFDPNNIWGIGGDKGSYTSYLLDSHFISGANREETLAKYSEIMESL